jgi:hypothetical protein
MGFFLRLLEVNNFKILCRVLVSKRCSFSKGHNLKLTFLAIGLTGMTFTLQIGFQRF